jgi:hypothetical protein
LLLAACSADTTTNTAPSLSFAYSAIGPPGTIDQTLEIRNRSDRSVVPVLRLTALDASGEPLAGVTVKSVYGSDRGELAVPPAGALDILVMKPETRIGEVADVRAEVVSTAPTTSIGAQPVEVSAASADGNLLPKEAPFASVSLNNPNPEPARVRVVHLVYDAPPPGRSQQVISIVPLAGPIDVPAGAPLLLPLDSAAVQAVAAAPRGAVIIKAYLTP